MSDELIRKCAEIIQSGAEDSVRVMPLIVEFPVPNLMPVDTAEYSMIIKLGETVGVHLTKPEIRKLREKCRDNSDKRDLWNKIRREYPEAVAVDKWPLMQRMTGVLGWMTVEYMDQVKNR